MECTQSFANLLSVSRGALIWFSRKVDESKLELFAKLKIHE